MKLPWDGKYLKIGFHVAVTAVTVYILIMLVNSAAYVITNLEGIFSVVRGIFDKMFSIFTVLITAFVIAYLFDPAVDFFQERFNRLHRRRLVPFFQKNGVFQKYGKWREKIKIKFSRNRDAVKVNEDIKPRTAGTAILYALVLIIVTTTTVLLFIVLGGRIKDIADADIVVIVSDWLSDISEQFNSFYGSVSETLMRWNVEQYVSDFITGVLVELSGFINSLSRNIVSIITTAGSSIANFVLSVVVAFYFLRDKNKIKQISLEVLDVISPFRLKNFILGTLTEIHTVFSGYIRGQLLDGAIMAVLISTALTIIGVDFSVLIGIVSGFSNLIPYFGAIIGFILSISVCLLSGEPTKALAAAIAIVVLQQIDGIFMVPRIVGKKVELSPALVLLSLAVFGNLFGILGMVFAVPTCAIIKVFLSRYFERRKRVKELNRMR